MIESHANSTGEYGFLSIIFDSLNPNIKGLVQYQVFFEIFDIFNFEYVSWLQLLKIKIFI